MKAMLSAMIVILLVTPRVIAESEQPKSPPPPPQPAADPTPPWKLDFDYKEIAPNPGAGGPVTRIKFSVSESGEYKLTKTVHDTSGKLTDRKERSDKLAAAERKQLLQIITKTDLPALAPGPLDLAAGSGTEDGWSGTVSFSQGDKTTVVSFSSQGGWPVDPKKQERLTRFSNFLDHVKNLTAQELNKKDP
jgi:hypothetical protein